MLLLTRSEAAAAEGLRRALTVALLLLLVGCTLALVIPGFAVAAWRRGWWSAGRRVYFTIVSVAVLVFVPLLAYYHLLGFWL